MEGEDLGDLVTCDYVR